MGQSFSELERAPGAGLTKKDVERLKRRFVKLSRGSNTLSVGQFEMMPEFAGNPFLPRLFEMFDTNKDGRITLEEFNEAIDYFLRLNTTEDRLKFAFKIYDISGNGLIAEKELYTMLEKSTGSHLSVQQLQTVVKSTIQEYDKDGDGKLNYREFKALLSPGELDATALP